MRLDVKMKSGGPWNLKGLRPDARTAARPSGMSVGDWLNTVIDPAEPQSLNAERSGDTGERQADRSRRQSGEDFRDPGARRQMNSSPRPRDDRSDEPLRENPQDDDDDRFERYRDRAPRYRASEIDEAPSRTAARGDERTRYRNRRSELYDREIDELQRQFVSAEGHTGERNQDRVSAERERGGDVRRHARDHDQDQASLDAPPLDYGERDPEDDAEQGLPAHSLRRSDADTGSPSPAREALAPRDERPVDRDVDHPGRAQAPSRRPHDEAPRAERQRRERELFERAAVAAAEQRRQSSIDQAVAEIAARQRALDQDRAIEPRESAPTWGVDTAAMAAPPSKAPPQAPQPEVRHDAAAATERVFAPWPDGWRSPATAEVVHEVARAPQRAASAKSDLLKPELPRLEPSEPASSKSEPPFDLSGLQDQLREMTARIEALRPSRELENAIVGLRSDLAEISRSFAEALPRRALESLENEVRALGQRIDRSRQAGMDSAALSGVERGLADVREALRGLMPAEGLAGFDGALRAIAGKVDAIGAKDDPAALRQLEAAMDVLRSMIARVASNEALGKVAEDVRALSVKVDHVAGGGTNQPTLAALENRIDILASALSASAEAGHAVPRELEKLLSGLLEKLELVQLTHTDRAALSHLEDRIAGLVRRLDASDARLGLLEGVERGLADLLAHIEQLRGFGNAGSAVVAVPPAFAVEPERADTTIKQTERTGQAERSKQTERGRQTESLSRVSLHDDLFEDAQVMPARAARRASVATAEPRSEQPDVVSAAPPPENYEGRLETDVAASEANSEDVTTRTAPIDPTFARPPAPRTPIDPSLPPDHPLEPGSTGRPRGSSSAAERTVVSEAAGPKPPGIAEPTASKPDFIAAARRAAQAASAAPAQGKNPTKAGVGRPKSLTERLRTLAVAAAVVVIVVGGFHIISRLFEDGSGASSPARIEAPSRPSGAPSPQAEPPHTQSAPLEALPEATPARKEPPHVEAEPSLPPLGAANWPTSLQVPLPTVEPAQKSAEVVATPTAPSLQPVARRDGKPDSRAPEGATSAAGAPMDITGAMSDPPSPTLAPANAPAPRPAPNAAAIADRLPATIGGSTLRVAALAGDPLAAYEVGVRFSEGRGVPANNEEAARWFEIAAKKGVVPAQFRLGTLYEKGLGVKKNPTAARDYYRAAAEKGHGKATHNLAVIYAEGAEGKPDYVTAAQWFRKAADYGVTDSQYNLAILYARGVGVEQNLVESYKWFFLAAKEGDQDAAQKRDEIASRLDRPALAAARAAAESWIAVPQPAEAISVKGVWDPPGTSQPATKPKPRSAKAVRLEASKVN
jgi:localization factor PodJL